MNITINNNSNNNSHITIDNSTSLADLIKALGNVEEQEKTPTPKKLRETAGDPVAKEEGCLVYANGYCVYTNCTGSTVMFVPGCKSFTYRFNGLNDSETGILTDHQDIGEEEFCALPWHIALTVRGDHRIEYNSFNRAGDRKRERSEDDEDSEKQTEKKVYRYNPGYHFESPEAAYIRKETIREALSKLTEKQKEVYLLYHRDGYNEYEIAELLGIDRTSVHDRLKSANKKISKNISKLL